MILGAVLLLSSCGGGGDSGATTGGSAGGTGSGVTTTAALDTDGDGLTDDEEINIYGTSPVLVDTDGDGFSDKQELKDFSYHAGQPYRYNPLIADLPRLRVELSGTPTLGWNVSTTSGLTNFNSSSIGGANSQSTEVTHSAGIGLSAEFSTMAGAEAGTGGVTGTASQTVTLGLELNYSFTQSFVDEVSREWAKVRSQETSTTTAISGGNMFVGVNIFNDSNIPFKIKGMQLALWRLSRINSGLIQIGNLGLDNKQSASTFLETTLSSQNAGGGSTSMIFSNDNLSIPDTRNLMEDIGSIILKPSSITLVDKNDVSFDFSEFPTRTARVSIDFGLMASGTQALMPIDYYVATNRDPNIQGVTLRDILKDVGVSLVIAPTAGWPDSINGSKAPTFSGIQSVVWNVPPDIYQQVDNDPLKRGVWVVLHTTGGADGLQNVVKRYDVRLEAYDPDSIRIRSGDHVVLVYIEDNDNDGLGNREEALAGTDPENRDTDADGLLDFDEVRKTSSWQVEYYDSNSVPPQLRSYTVYSSPISADADGDLLSDFREKALGTDPNKKDTDGDGVDDVEGRVNLAAAPVQQIAAAISSSVSVEVFSGSQIMLAGQIKSNITGATATATTSAKIKEIFINWGDGTPIERVPVAKSKYIFSSQTPKKHSYPKDSYGVYLVKIISRDDQQPVNEQIDLFTVTVRPSISYSDTFLSTNSWSNAKHPRFVADVNGDKKDDLIGFANTETVVALSTGSGFGLPKSWHNDNVPVSASKINFVNLYPANYIGVNPRYDQRHVVDMNNDGKADVVAFGRDGVHVGLSTGSAFDVTKWFGAPDLLKTSTVNLLADVDGDFDLDWVKLKPGSISCYENKGVEFITREVGQSLTLAGASWKANKNPRYLLDINGDGKADLIGFSHGAVWVSLGQGNCLFEKSKTVFSDSSFSVLAGFDDSWNYPRMLKDVNDDGLPDIVGFGSNTVYVALNTSTKTIVSFDPAYNAMPSGQQFGFDQGWKDHIYYDLPYNLSRASYNFILRDMADLDGDGDLDIFGYASDNLYAGINDGKGFFTFKPWGKGEFALLDQNWNPDFLGCTGSVHGGFDSCINNWYSYRTVGDVTGDGRTDFVGFGKNSVVAVPGILVEKGDLIN